ncbi:glycosyltransferase 87 family protein [Virgisporangium ochraceum]|uniref:Membrane protein n=1 Tax=Virgisporangium ochraceum TaxID=65505 RepID=A0A8J3ZKV2_9ACTN|nr:glycosyltransferase 87 family protein [Virgisporangium ochraceum]GIJ66184.1 membrane protein [Virgisporangium ochraceum]
MSTATPLDNAPDAAAVPDEPATSDGFVRGLAEAIGGPLGEHAVRPVRSVYGRGFWTAGRVVLALVCITLSLHWVQKFPCNDGAWSGLEQYKYMCYTDTLALYYAEELSEGAVPYKDFPVEYPVVTGAFMGLIGLPVNALGDRAGALNEGQLFYNLNVLALGALAIATVALLLAVRRKRPWDVAMFAVAPGLFLSATVNWDLLAIGLTMLGWYFWARSRPALAGVFIALAASAKLWPALLALPLLALCWRARRMRDFNTAAWTGVFTLALVNIPVLVLWPDSWARFFQLNSERPVDWGTFWYIGANFPLGNDRYGLRPFQWLSDNLPMQNAVSWVVILLAIAAVMLLAVRAPRRPRLAQVAFLVVALFLVFNKVWSQQFVLWLIPLLVLARPKWGAFLAWQAAEVAYFAAFYGRLMGESGKVIFPEWVFVWASELRLIMVGVLIWLVVKEILHPELDVVRQTYDDDPDGGVLDGTPDRDDWPEGWTADDEPAAVPVGVPAATEEGPLSDERPPDGDEPPTPVRA